MAVAALRISDVRSAQSGRSGCGCAASSWGRPNIQKVRHGARAPCRTGRLGCATMTVSKGRSPVALLRSIVVDHLPFSPS